MKKLLWLDDMRDPNSGDWLLRYASEYYYHSDVNKVYWVKDYDEFTQWINQNGLPDKICFDHDLGLDRSGYDAAKWIVEYCIDNNLDMPEWRVQSANPVGVNNINQLLNKAKNHLDNSR